MRWSGLRYVWDTGQSADRVLVGRPEGKRPLGRESASCVLRLRNCVGCVIKCLPHVISCVTKCLPHVISCVTKCLPHVISCVTKCLPHVISCVTKSLPHVISCVTKCLPHMISCVTKSLPQVISCVTKCCLTWSVALRSVCLMWSVASRKVCLRWSVASTAPHVGWIACIVRYVLCNCMHTYRTAEWHTVVMSWYYLMFMIYWKNSLLEEDDRHNMFLISPNASYCYDVTNIISAERVLVQ